MEENMDLFDFVYAYMQQINQLQAKYLPRMMSTDENSATVFHDYQIEANQIYTQYLTNRKRSYYYGIDHPPKFAIVSHDCRHTIELNKNRAVITIYTDTKWAGGLDFQFHLIYSKEQWLINSFKQRYHSSDRRIEYQWHGGRF